ncbi:MAG TPA: UDP-N-acetylmuramoyl-tripeptide--D-alanyl-D-alanine ligase [Steroidobacteraceae bacterium]|nr:UDP-N-acetylmuramoyl-tripeptide--D-alanyl-D-alanine ligase [Steroidobacteraceae bacterium]
MKRTLGDFAHACGGRLHGADRTYTTVSTDTRTLSAGELFVALHGPNFNGNEFIGAAEKAGAAGAVVDAEQPVAMSQIVVKDTQAALEKAAQSWRKTYSNPVIGVAGSNGKTTVKEMTAGILAQAGDCLATRGNLNNHIGVPLTLFRLDPAHRFAVVEMGANHPGELAALVEIARPTIGLITNAGAEHLEGFGSLEGAARAEGEMVAGLEPDATAIINADDEFATLWRGMTRAKIVTFGLEKTADFTAADVRTDISANGFVTRYTLVSPMGRAPVELKVAGKHNVMNSLCAAAAASAAGVKLEHIVAGLSAVQAVKGRLQFKKTRNGAWLIDDSYNANPSSVHAGIEVLAQLEGRKWLVFGQMGELGEFANEAHIEIGTYARTHGIERMFAVGDLAKLTVQTFGPGAEWFADTTTLSQALEAAATADVRLLIKGSRSNRLERVVEALGAVAPAAQMTAAPAAQTSRKEG